MMGDELLPLISKELIEEITDRTENAIKDEELQFNSASWYAEFKTALPFSQENELWDSQDDA